jgi:ribosomal protein L5
MVKITKVTVERAEGKAIECYKSEHDTLESADFRLREIARTAPEGGGYDKTDVIIYFDDGTRIESRHDVQRYSTDGTVYSHAKSWLEAFSKGKPSNIFSKEDIEEFKSLLKKLESAVKEKRPSRRKI